MLCSIERNNFNFVLLFVSKFNIKSVERIIIEEIEFTIPFQQ